MVMGLPNNMNVLHTTELRIKSEFYVTHTHNFMFTPTHEKEMLTLPFRAQITASWQHQREMLAQSTARVSDCDLVGPNVIKF